jgi:Na+/melibiose symporter-like transporter
MKTDIETRRIISIVTGLTFLLVSVTGALLFFHVKSGPLVDLHEWIGILFLITAVWHLAINWRSFTSYLNNRAFWLGALGVALVCALIIKHARRARERASRRQPRNLQHYYSTMIGKYSS